MNTVLLCGFPKTGNTWIRFIVMNYFNILNHGATETLTYKELIRIQRHRIEYDLPGYKKDNYKPFEFDEGFPPVYHTHVSCIKPYTDYFDKFDKIVYILRNPYDTMISYYHYLTNRDKPFNGRHSEEETEYLLNMDFFIRYYLSNYLSHILITKPKASLVLDYDKLRKDPTLFRSLIEIFGIEVNENILKKAIEISSFDSIKAMGRKTNQKYGLATSYRGEFTRNGNTGQYKRILSPEMIEYIRKRMDGINMEKEFVDSYYLDANDFPPLGRVPKWLDLEINTNCNIICSKCFRKFYIPKTEYIDWNLAIKIIWEFGQKGGKSIRFIERGEPTLCPDLVIYVQIANDLGLRTVINTNGIELTPELSKNLINAGISQISCAIDSCHEETYEKLQGRSFKRVISNLKEVYKLSRNTKTIIQVHVNVQKENAEEVYMGRYNDFFEQYSDKVIHQPTYDICNFDEDNYLDHKPCIEPWRRLIVLVDGRVMLCPACFNYHTKKVFEVGDLSTKSLESIWNRILMRKIRKWHLDGELNKMWPCRACRVRRYTNKKKEVI